MRKYFLNPFDIFCAMMLLFLSGGLLILTVLTAIFNIKQIFSGDDVSILLCWLVLFAFALFFVCYSLLYWNKNKGYLYVGQNSLILKKARQEVQFNISDIKWVEFKHYRRGFKPIAKVSRYSWKFEIRLNQHKKNLDFIITNDVMIDIVEKNKIRIMPDAYNKAYLDGTMDLRKIKTKNK